MRISFSGLFAIALALLTGLCLGQLTTLGISGQQSARPSPTAQARVVNEFYAAINTYLESGESPMLNQVVSPTIVSNMFDGEEVDGRDGLRRYLDELRSISSQMQLVPGEMTAVDEGAIVKVAVVGLENVELMGIPVTATDLWGDSDLLEIRDGRIAALWSSLGGGLHVGKSAGTSFQGASSASIRPTIEEWTLTPNFVYWPEASFKPTLLRLISGNASIVLNHTGSEGENLIFPQSDPAGSGIAMTKGPGYELAPGDLVSIAAETAFVIEGKGIMPPTVAVLTLEELTSTALPVMRNELYRTDGVPRKVLARPDQDVAYDNGYLLESASVRLQSNTHKAQGHEMLYLISGELNVTIDGGEAWMSGPDRLSERITNRYTLTPGTGLVVTRGASITYESQTTGGANVWLSTLTESPTD